MPYRTAAPRETTRTIVVRRANRFTRGLLIVSVSVAPVCWIGLAVSDEQLRTTALVMAVVSMLVVGFLMGGLWRGRVELVADRATGQLRSVNRMGPWPNVVQVDATAVIGVRVQTEVGEGGTLWVVRLDDGSGNGPNVSRHETEGEATVTRERALALLAWLRDEPASVAGQTAPNQDRPASDSGPGR